MAKSASASSLQTQQTLVIGLFWGWFLTMLLAVWTGQKFAATALPIIIGMHVVHAAIFLLALLQLRDFLALRREGSGFTAVVQRPLVAFLLIGASIVLVGLACGLAFQEKIAAFPIVSGAVALGLLGITAAIVVLMECGKLPNTQNIIRSLLDMRQVFAIVLLVLGVAMFVVGVVWSVTQRENLQPVLPYTLGLVMGGLVWFGAGLWQLFMPPDSASATNLRILLLAVGGATGAILFLMTGLGVINWWDQIVGGGISAWRGDEGWSLWLTIWLALLGLVLMFGSLFLAHGDIRKNVILRRLLYGYNAVFMGLLLLAVLVVTNILVYASFPYNYNWTKTQALYSLADKSKQILGKLKSKDKSTIFVLMAQAGKDYNDVRHLLENAQAYAGNKLEVRYISPDQDSQEYLDMIEGNDYPELKNSLQGAGGRGILIVHGKRRGELPALQVFISEDDLTNRKDLQMQRFHRRGGNPDQPHEFRGERLIMTQLDAFTDNKKKPVIYFTQSNEELVVTNDVPGHPAGAGELKEYLKKNNYEVKSLFFRAERKDDNEADAVYTNKAPDKGHKIPSNPEDVVVIAWPEQKFTKEAQDALHDHMARGGRLVVFSSIINLRRVIREPNLSELLKKYGVEMQENVIYMAGGVGPQFEMTDLHQANMAKESDNPIARTFGRFDFYVRHPMVVKPAESGAGGWRAESIMEIRPRQGFYLVAEKNKSYLINMPRYLHGKIRDGKIADIAATKPLSIAVAVKDREDKPRIVVFGSGELASNRPVQVRPLPPYKDLMLSTMEWLAARPHTIAIDYKTTNKYKMQSDADTARMVFLPFGLMLLGLIGLGAGIWVVRRR